MRLNLYLLYIVIVNWIETNNFFTDIFMDILMDLFKMDQCRMNLIFLMINSALSSLKKPSNDLHLVHMIQPCATPHISNSIAFLYISFNLTTIYSAVDVNGLSSLMIDEIQFRLQHAMIVGEKSPWIPESLEKRDMVSQDCDFLRHSKQKFNQKNMFTYFWFYKQTNVITNNMLTLRFLYIWCFWILS